VVVAVTRRGRRLSIMVGVTAVVTVIAGCSSRSPSMLDPQSPQARHISRLWWLMFTLAAVIYVAVIALVVVAMVRRRAGDDQEPMPHEDEQANNERRDGRFLLYGGLVLPTIVLAVIGVQTVRVSESLGAAAAQVHIVVDAEPWWWRITYPDDGVVTANEIHVPVGEQVDISLRSNNVIHSLWVPQLNGKTDVVPGQTNHLAFTADAAGTYRGQCAEFCGIEHAKMSFTVVAQQPDEYRAWLAANRTPAATPQTDEQQRGATILQTQACAGCHTVSGTSANGTLGPDLSHIASRATIGANTLPNTPEEMRRWLSATQQVKPGALMPQLDLTADQVQALVAYMENLT
jgi:cytochrome c oxidase subunit 2